MKILDEKYGNYRIIKKRDGYIYIYENKLIPRQVCRMPASADMAEARAYIDTYLIKKI